MCVCLCVYTRDTNPIESKCILLYKTTVLKIELLHTTNISSSHHNGMKSPTNSDTSTYFYSSQLIVEWFLVLSGLLFYLSRKRKNMDNRKWTVSDYLLLVFISILPHTAYCNKAMTPNGCEWDFAVAHFWLVMLMALTGWWVYFIVIWKTVLLLPTTLYECVLYTTHWVRWKRFGNQKKVPGLYAL